MIYARLLSLFLITLLFASCSQDPEPFRGRLIVGIINSDTGAHSLEKYGEFKSYLAKKTGTLVELEPTLNELVAVDRVHRREWSIVFAPPGLAAIAIGREQYIPIFPLQAGQHLRGVLVVKKESPLKKLSDLSQKVVALGQPGSAAGYYMPLYDLYGLTLAEIRFAPTPKMTLEWVAQGSVDVGALSETEFQRYRHEFKNTEFRVVHKTRLIPPGVVLLGPTVDRNQQEQIVSAMREASPTLIGDAGYLPTTSLPNYKEFIQFVDKVRPIETKLRKKPAILLNKLSGQP